MQKRKKVVEIEVVGRNVIEEDEMVVATGPVRIDITTRRNTQS